MFLVNKPADDFSAIITSLFKKLEKVCLETEVVWQFSHDYEKKALINLCQKKKKKSTWIPPPNPVSDLLSGTELSSLIL